MIHALLMVVFGQNFDKFAAQSYCNANRKGCKHGHQIDGDGTSGAQAIHDTETIPSFPFLPLTGLLKVSLFSIKL